MSKNFKQWDLSAFTYQSGPQSSVSTTQSEDGAKKRHPYTVPSFPIDENQAPVCFPATAQPFSGGECFSMADLPRRPTRKGSWLPDVSDFSCSREPQLSIHPAPVYPKAEPLANLGKDYKKSIVQQRGSPFINELMRLYHLPLQDNPKDLIPELEQAIEKEWIIGSYKDSLYEYKSGIWKPYSRSAFITDVRNRYSTEISHANFGIKHFEELYNRLLTSPFVTLARSDCPSPFDQNPNLINLKDCVYSLDENTLLESDFRFYFSTQLNIPRSAFDGEIFSPNFDHFVETSLNGDQALRTLLLELIGVLLVGKRLRYVFVLYGPSGCGKSLMIDLIQRIIGLDHVQTFNRLKDLGDSFFLGDLIGKQLLYCSDFPNKPLDDNSVALLKQLTGDSVTRANRKYRDSVIVQNTCNILLASNHPIRAKSKDLAFSDARLLILPFPCSIDRSEQDLNLGAKLFEERGAIFQMAMDAYRNLENRNFMFTTYSESYLPGLEDQQSFTHSLKDGICEFVHACCHVSSESETSVSELFTAYQEFCISHEIPYTRAPSSFSRMLLGIVPGIVSGKTSKNGKGSRTLQGIQIQTNYNNGGIL